MSDVDLTIDEAAPEAERIARRSARWPWIGTLLLVALMPLPLGSYRPWAWSLAGLCAALLVIAWSLLALRGRAPLAWRGALWLPVAAMTLLVLWAIVQALPLAPAAWENPLWPLARQALGGRFGGTISAAPEATWPALIRLGTTLAIFWLTLSYGRDRDRAEQALHWAAIAGGLYALYGLINFIAGNSLLLWFPRTSYLTDITGTFVNRNSYATYAGIGLLVAIVLAVRSYRARVRVGDPSLSPLGRGIEAMTGWPAIYSTIAVITAMAWVQTHSRMGFVATVGGLFTLLVLMRLAGIVRSKLVLVVIGLGALVGVLLVSGNALIERIGETGSFDRAPLFASVEQMIQTAPWIGGGYGSFASLYQMYRDPAVLPGADIIMAHNSYLELAAEVGLPATIALVLAVFWLALLCLIGVFQRSRDQIIPALAVAATMLIAIHAVTDFSMQMPGVAALYALLLGVGVAQSWSPEQRGRKGRR